MGAKNHQIYGMVLKGSDFQLGNLNANKKLQDKSEGLQNDQHNMKVDKQILAL